MAIRRCLVAVAAVLVMLTTACSTTAEVTADEPPGITPTAEPDRDPPTPDDDPAGPQGESAQRGRQVPPFALPPTAPGSDEAYLAMIDDLDRFITDEQRDAGVPWPDLRNPDPIAAYQSCAEFQNWMSENNTTPSLVEGYTAPGSPERGWDLELFGDYTLFDVVSTPSRPPYSMRVEGVVHPAATDITDALLAQVPEGSAAVVYYDSVGVSQLVRPDGSVFSTSPGWVDEGPWVAIMAPTEVGWQVWWDELTEVPPPGLDDDRGQPDTPPPRSDL